MPADKQYEDARQALRIIEKETLTPGAILTYGSLAKALGHAPANYARHIGQVCSLIDAACYWAKLPFLSIEKVRLDDTTHNPDSFNGGFWDAVKTQLFTNSSSRDWSSDDIAKLIRTLDQHMNGEGALKQWEKIESFGKAAVERAASYK